MDCKKSSACILLFTVASHRSTNSGVDICLTVVWIFFYLTTNTCSARSVLDPKLRETTVCLLVRHKLWIKDCNSFRDCQFCSQLSTQVYVRFVLTLSQSSLSVEGMILAIVMRRPVGWQAQQCLDTICRTYGSVSAWKYPRYVPCQRESRYFGTMPLSLPSSSSLWISPALGSFRAEVVRPARRGRDSWHREGPAYF
ncbi:hypothetical protein F5146DRAFT_144621 [Armillaria mellea]|nr:hypothetical protein F5146DRAFT_144621 [Armillaria mellea]